LIHVVFHDAAHNTPTKDVLQIYILLESHEFLGDHG
jgi:hypothetical protein